MAYIVSIRFREAVKRVPPRLRVLKQPGSSLNAFIPSHRRKLRRPCRRLMPNVLVKSGRLRGVIYSSDKEQCGRPRTFIHFMDTPPLLASDADGKQLYIVGGKYRVTSRGIEG